MNVSICRENVISKSMLVISMSAPEQLNVPCVVRRKKTMEQISDGSAMRADQWWLVPYCSDECVKTSFKFLQESGNDPFEAKKLAKIAKLKLDGTKLGDNK
jgi:hypothetical protein